MSRISEMTDEEFWEWLKPLMPPVDAKELVARIRRQKGEALQSPFQNVWLAGGQIPRCEALGHRVYHWNYEGWQVFQHGQDGEARMVYKWDMSHKGLTDDEYLQDWEAMMERVRQWADEIHSWAALDAAAGEERG